MNFYEDVLQETLKEFPNFKVVPKSQSPFMRFLAKLLFFNKQFMTGFTTTIGNFMWVPDDFGAWSPESRAALLRHERVHLRQQRRYTLPVYALMYLLWPLPLFYAHGRMKLEREAYTESIRAYAEYFGVDFVANPETRDSIISNFTSSAYGWMWVRREDMEGWYDDTLEALRTARGR